MPAISDFKGFSFQPPGGHLWPWFLVGILLVLLALWVYRRNPAPMSRPLKGVLVAIRAAAFLILLLLICRPVISLGAADRGRRLVALLVDTSESLTLPAGGDAGGATRADQVRTVLGEIRSGLADRHGLRAWGFDRQARPLAEDLKLTPPPEALAPVGDVTAMGPAVEAAVAEIGRARAGAVVVVSDGVANQGIDPVAVARRLSLPVYTVGVGSDSIRLDAAVARIQVNRTAFLGDDVPLSVTVHNTGVGGTSVELDVVDVTRPGREEVVAKQALVWANEGAEQQVRMKFRPSSVGQHFYEVRVPARADEFTSVNNRRMFALDVREEKNRVLVIAGTTDWDLTFFGRALAADSSLSVTTMVRMGGQWRSIEKASQSVSFAPDAASLGKYVLVVLDGLDARDLSAASWEALAAWTRRGGGLLVFGGAQGSGIRRLAGTPVAGLLPVDPASAQSNGSSSIGVTLTAAGGRHPATEVYEGESDNTAAWTDLPPLSSASAEPAVKGGAEVLVSGSDEFPVLVAGRAGAGKVLVAPAAGFWRWAFRPEGREDRRDFHERLWVNAARWLTSPDLASRLHVEPGRPVFERGDAVDITARLADGDYQPLDGAEINVTITRDDSLTTPRAPGAPEEPAVQPRSLSLAGSGGGFYAGETGSLKPGRYRFRAQARKGDKSLGEATGSFAVETMGLEFRRPAADPGFLARLAAESGGTYYAAADARRLPEELVVSGKSSQEVVTLDIWDSPWFFVAFVGLLSSEWFLRRRRGMV
ncbi:MAG TPA: hypothetical protein VF720_14290 [Candidatus Eisenbacteria bacterium]